MSRTRHRTSETIERESRRRRPRSRLTQGKGAAEYMPGIFDVHDGGGNHNWFLWLRDYCGYGKQRKRRRTRRIMKRYGRRVDRQRGKQELRDRTP